MKKTILDDFCIFSIKSVVSLLAISIISQLFSESTVFCNWLSVIIWLMIINKTRVVGKEFTIILFPLIVWYSFAILSELYFEQFGSYTPELRLVTYETGGVVRLVLYNCILFIGCDIAFGKNKIKVEKISKWNKFIIYFIYLVILILLISSLIIYGIPLLEGMNRFLFWNKEIDNPVLAAARVNTPFVVMLIMFLIKEETKVVCMLVITIIIVTVLGGDKFSAFINCILYSLIIVVIRQKINMNRKNVIKFSIACLLLFFLLFNLIAYHYAEISNVVNVNEMFEERLVEQGQVWWMVDQIARNDNMYYCGEIVGFIDEVKAGFLLHPDPYYYGMYKIMRAITSQDMVLQYYEFGVEFTEGYPAIGLIFFGYFGLGIFQIFVGYIYGKLSTLFYQSICLGDAIGCLMMSKINYLLILGLVGGNLWKMFSYKLVLFIAVYIVWNKVRFRLKNE